MISLIYPLLMISQDASQLESILNTLGAEGWELALYRPRSTDILSNGAYIFKRCKVE
jgi:hypothetical protein